MCTTRSYEVIVVCTNNVTIVMLHHSQTAAKVERSPGHTNERVKSRNDSSNSTRSPMPDATTNEGDVSAGVLENRQIPATKARLWPGSDLPVHPPPPLPHHTYKKTTKMKTNGIRLIINYLGLCPFPNTAGPFLEWLPRSSG